MTTRKEYLGLSNFKSKQKSGDPIIGYSDYGGDYTESGTRKKGFLKNVTGDYFEGHVNPSDERTIRNEDQSRRAAKLHAKTQEFLGELGINKS